MAGTKEHKMDIAKAVVRIALEQFTADERSGGGLVELKQARVTCKHRLARATPAPAPTAS